MKKSDCRARRPRRAAKYNNINKIIAILLILTLCLPFIFACGEKSNDSGAKKDDGNAGTDAPAVNADNEKPADDEEPPTETEPEPTEPPTEKPTEAPTEPPTDPANLPEAETNGLIPGARYYLWSPNSNLYITCDKWGSLTQEEYTGDPDQMFVFEKIELDTGKTAYKVRALGTENGYLDTDGGDGETNGLAVIATLEPEGENSHFWSVTKQTKPKGIDLPTLAILSVISKSKKSLDVSGISKDPGANIQVWDGGSADNHKLVFELVADVEQGKIIPRGLQELPDDE